MKFHLNLILAWLWILLGFATGMVLGMFFHGENWLGGYGSFKRRMYRLGHISFFGLGVVNLLFCLTAQTFSLTEGQSANGIPLSRHGPSSSARSQCRLAASSWRISQRRT